MFSDSLTYDDIGIVPTKRSDVISRDKVDPSVEFLGKKSSLPIMLAPMDKVVGPEMVEAIRAVGGLCSLPREFSGEVVGNNVIYSIPCDINRLKELEKRMELIAPLSVVLIDTANGFHIAIQNLVEIIKKEYPTLKIIAGNVGSIEGFNFLSDIGVDAVRVGIGNGSVCSTSIATGIGQGQASLIRDIAEWSDRPALLIADGGIKTPGDVVKAIALGADIVMVGKVFAGCRESPGTVVKFGGQKYKQYAGQASHAVKKSDKYVEGDDTLVAYSGRVSEMWSKFEDGVRSAMAYLNCNTIAELRNLPYENFRKLSPAAKVERGVHANGG